MQIIISWPWFCAVFGLLLVITFMMSLQSAHFYTKDNVIYKFSIIDLELPSTPTELVNLIKGLYKLPEPLSKKAVSALKGQLYIDFLFMPCAYGALFLLCMRVSEKMQPAIGADIFLVLAWLQGIAWLCDIIENIYLLRKIDPNPVLSSHSVHKAYLYMEALKWGIALTAAICAVSIICYFWLSGFYSAGSLRYAGIMAGEIILFLIASMIFLKKNKTRAGQKPVQA
ncbi:MAG: hypothetical protein Q8941_06385 [Bacteroidota bacterium]|nr:hypothetical protein [Bacteroidota bacterium]